MKGDTGVIHTKSSYAPGLEVDLVSSNDSMIDLNTAIGNLEAKELAFYHSIFKDVNSYNEFINKVRKIFADNENDMLIFKQFSNKNLQKLLPDYEPPVFERGYELTLIGDAATINLAEVFDSDVISVINNKTLSISVIPQNASQIKRVLNTILKRRGGNKFKDNDDITRNLKNILDLGEAGSKTIEGLLEVSVSNKPIRKTNTVFDVVKFASKKKNKSEYWRKSDLKKLREMDPQSLEVKDAIKEIKSALKNLKKFLFKDYGRASEKMQQAMDAAWNETGGSNLDKGGINVLSADFFFEGNNYEKIILGQIGEFGNLVFDKYLALHNNSGLPPKLIQIIGSEIKKAKEGGTGQQPHTDLEIMLACGANVNQQTKNIQDDSQIPVRTNAELISPLFGENFTTSIVNFFTNSDYKSTVGISLTDYIDILKDFYYAAMNLNINDNLDQKQMNTFYFIGGEHLVPASEILKTLEKRYQRDKKMEFVITGGRVPSLDDENYRKQFKEYRYWRYTKGTNRSPDKMKPREDNMAAYASAAQKISIQTSFSIPALLKGGSFSIFKRPF